ncbi:MAG: hypothetical protein FJX60_23515 [Alphaproteobacteria bacterium]|nr:hypothetical protein [Alphaproteobacteria bacterium]
MNEAPTPQQENSPAEQADQPAKGYERRRLIVAAVCVLVGAWAALLASLYFSGKNAEDRALRDTANLAHTFEEHLTRLVSGIDRHMLFLKRDFERDPSRFDLAQWLRDAPGLPGMAFQVGLIDADGLVVATSLGPIDRRISIADWEHFKVHAASDGVGLFIGRALQLNLTGKWAIQLTRRLNGPDGRFAGVISVSLDPEALSEFYRAFDIGRQGAVLIAGRDGYVRARIDASGPTAARTYETSVADSPMLTLPDPAGTF